MHEQSTTRSEPCIRTAIWGRSGSALIGFRSLEEGGITDLDVGPRLLDDQARKRGDNMHARVLSGMHERGVDVSIVQYRYDEATMIPTSKRPQGNHVHFIST